MFVPMRQLTYPPISTPLKRRPLSNHQSGGGSEDESSSEAHDSNLVHLPCCTRYDLVNLHAEVHLRTFRFHDGPIQIEDVAAFRYECGVVSPLSFQFTNKDIGALPRNA
jgi:hypothetical protein